MTHPRTVIKHEVKALLDPVELPIYVSRARDLKKGEDKAIIVYVTTETLSRASGTRENRPELPIIRTMTVEIVDLHRDVTRFWSEPLGLDNIAPSELSRILGEQGLELFGGSIAEG